MLGEGEPTPGPLRSVARRGRPFPALLHFPLPTLPSTRRTLLGGYRCTSCYSELLADPLTLLQDLPASLAKNRVLPSFSELKVMAPSSSSKKSPQQQQPTLRTLRHGAATTSAGSPTSKQPKLRATAALTVKEQIARRAAKPLIQGRQFKWISPAQRINEMQVDMSRVRDRRDMLEGEDDDSKDDETHSLFAHSLQTSQLINLTLPFIAFSRSVSSKARSLPLVIHHRQAIVQAVCEALKGNQHDVELCGEAILE